MKFWKLAITLVVLVAVAASCSSIPFLQKKATPTPTDVVDVQRGSISISINSSGNLDMPAKNKLSFGTGGTVLSVSAKIGDRVKKGQELASLDTTDLEKARQQAETSLKSAQYSLDKALTMYGEADLLKAETSVKQAQLSVDNAAKALADVQGAARLDVARQEAAVATAAAGVESARKNVEAPYDEVDIAKQKAAVATAQVTLSNAQKALEQAQKPDSPEVMRQRATVADDQNTLLLAQQNLAKATSPDSDLETARQALVSGRTGIAQTRNAVQSLTDPNNIAQVAQAQVYIASIISDLARGQKILTTAANISTTQAGLPNDIRTVATEVAGVQTAVANLQTGLLGVQTSIAVNIPQKKKLVESAQAAFAYAQDLYLQKSINATQLQAYITALQQNRQSLDAERQNVADTLTDALTDIDNLDYDLGGAQLDLATVLQHSDPLGLSSKKTAITRAQANLANDAKTLQDMLDPDYTQGKLKDVAVAKANLADAQKTLDDMLTGGDALTIATRKAALAKAQVDLADSQKTLNDMKDPLYIRGKENDLAAAKASLAAAQKTLSDVKAGADALDLEIKRNQVQTARDNLDKAVADLGKATIVSPIDGYVSEVTAEAGVTIGATAAAVTVIDVTQVEMDATVNEIDVPKIAVGQQAMISLDALPTARVMATLKSISPTARVQSGVVIYDITFTVQVPQNVELRAGMTATASVTTQRKNNVLLIPARAIVNRGGSTVVEVPSGAAKEVREVVTGLSDGLRTEIVSGLQEGDKVLVQATISSGSSQNRLPGMGGMGGFGGPPGGGPVIRTR